jgi:hypothetical protein
MLQIPVLIESVEDCGNGYGWSIVYLQGQEVYELAVLKNGKICYHTHITDDVVRGTWSTMSYYIQEIKYL